MKKKIIGLFLILIMAVCVGLTCVAKAEDSDTDPVTYTSSVVVNAGIEHGNVSVNTTEGNVGDVVTITVEPSVLYIIDAVYVNGTQILTNEDGLYQFALVEGENTVNAKFVLNNEALEALVEMMEKGKAEGFDTLFTPKNLISLVLILISLIEGTGLLVVVGKYKKATSIADEKAKQAVKETVPQELENNFKPFLINIQQTAEQAKDGVMTLARCFILNQEGTPEARLAIVDELTKVQNTNEEVAEKVVAAINGMIEQAKESQNAKIKAIEELEKANNNLTSENPEKDENIDTEGRY